MLMSSILTTWPWAFMKKQWCEHEKKKCIVIHRHFFGNREISAKVVLQGMLEASNCTLLMKTQGKGDENKVNDNKMKVVGALQCDNHPVIGKCLLLGVRKSISEVSVSTPFFCQKLFVVLKAMW